ncbi:MAG TPA: hypothetical protein VNH82_04115 [Candidatus Dormibacteraeota bacterium]|nr:hypothetical protein [Candidatus Dormibacteraeota bacterium]
MSSSAAGSAVTHRSGRTDDTAGLTSTVRIAQAKRAMLWGLAVLWLIDAGLQFQPTMFTFDFVSGVMQPSIASDPSWLGAISTWTFGWVSPHIAQWNWVFACTQLFIALGLFYGLIRRNNRAIVVGLVVSIFWGGSVWVFGEGTSGVFTGNGTLLTGGPGAVLLYVFIAAFYLLPDRWWQLSARFCFPRDALALLFLYGGLAQVLTPGYWGARGLPVLIEGQAAMAPPWMTATLTPGVTVTQANPVLWNAVFAILLFAIAILLFGPHPKTLGYWILGTTLVAIWYWGQALGGVFNSMGTDPNTPPLFVLLAIPGWLVWQANRQETTDQSLGPP